MAGLKAIVTWFPRERVALANGWMIMLGSLGAVTATAPTDWLLILLVGAAYFEILTIGSVTVGGLIYIVVPERVADPQIATSARKPLTLWSIYSDPRFLKSHRSQRPALARLGRCSHCGLRPGLRMWKDSTGRAASLKCSLWLWGSSLGALLLGAMADRLRKLNIRTEVLLAGVGALFIVAELAWFYAFACHHLCLGLSCRSLAPQQC